MEEEYNMAEKNNKDTKDDDIQYACNMIRSFAKSYFQRSTTKTIADYVLSHLLECELCTKSYKTYAKCNGYVFDLEQECINHIVGSLSDESDMYYKRTLKAFVKKYNYNPIEKNSKCSYLYYVNTMDIKKMRKVKILQEILDYRAEVDLNDEKDINMYADFGRYLLVKNAKILDNLEKCYALNMEVDKKNDENI